MATDRTARARLLAGRLRRLTASALFFLGPAVAGFAQPVLDFEERLDFDRTESWAMKYFASTNLLTGLGVPRSSEPGSVELGLEGLWIPSLSEKERTVGFNGTKTEDLNKTSVFVRPRLVIGLPRNLSLEVSYVPPIEVFDIEPHLLALGVGRPVRDSRRWRLGLRVYSQYGTLKGDFTCSESDAAARDDPERNPFGCEEPSRDETTIFSASAEVSVALKLGDGARFEPYFSLGLTRMDLEFQANARYRGIIDRSKLVTDGQTFYVALGTDYRVSPRWRWASEIFYSSLDVVRPPTTSTQNDPLLNARTVLRYALR